jgi:hypothetical protein
MKQSKSNCAWIGQLQTILLALAAASSCALQSRAGTDNALFNIKAEDVIASVHMDNVHFNTAAQTASKFHAERERLGADLLNTFNNQKSSRANQCIAAYYLGEMRYSSAADSLAVDIKVNLGDSDILIQGLPVILAYPARDALVKIGAASIPAVIRNLTESDDALVRALSFDVLTHVDGDKDIAGLRLQKALNAEKDSHKQARIQLALKELKK